MFRFPVWKPGVDHVLNLLKKYSTGFVFSFLFIYGVRYFSSFAMGMSGLAWSRFAMLNFIAAGVWADCFSGAGYLAGMALQHVLGDLATGFGLLMLAAFLIVIAVLFKMSRRRSNPPQPVKVPATVPNRNVPARAE